MIVATMFATSCSKDDGDNVEQPVAKEVQNEDNNKSEVQNVATRPIVIKAKNGATLSKVATTNGYDFTFSEGDKLVLTDGETTYATLEIDGEAGSSSATFKGEISTAADNKSIYAVIEGQSPLSEVKTSTVSLADVVQSNCYFKSESFDYNANSEFSVTLNDQNAYLVFNVSENQKKVNIGSEWYEVSDGKCYAAVPAGDVSGRFFGTKTAKSSEIYTITRTDVIDLGPSFNILWKTENLTLGASKTATIDGKTFGYYLWNTVNQNYSNGTEHAPDSKQLQDLASLAKGGFTTYNGMDYCKEFSNEYGAVYFPAAGRYDGDQNFYEGKIRGVYWTTNSLNVEEAMGMSFYENNDVPVPVSVSGHAKHHYFSVRLVRDINN